MNWLILELFNNAFPPNKLYSAQLYDKCDWLIRKFKTFQHLSGVMEPIRKYMIG